MNKKVLVGVMIAVLAVGGIAALVFSQKDDLSTHHEEHEQAASNKEQQTTGTSSNPAAATDKVTIEGFSFIPATIKVKKGTKVTWTNQDSAPHTVTADDGQAGPASGNLGKGESYSFTYDTAGTFSYHCAIHPSMTAKVEVTE